ncbi:GNAT family N-acetyltransferase [Sphaerisporangium album]|uniref:GNAT family N-acetyltransferase n=2 Tax=Sphaerisporangium album TaxID=509200 RepID=A0A367FKE1_9ACTN|nr:GNAT family N-acetyltransferase [Sphaerisporangium album]
MTAEQITAERTAAERSEAAARRAGVEVRELREIADFEAVAALFDTIWKAPPTAVPITVELMIAFAHSGNYVAGAFEGERLAGASIGFLAGPPGTTLHSHVTGAAVGRGIGFALKLHQRAWALAQGLTRITWTYDPLVRRNAHFNITKLGARPEAYLPSFYGRMEDAVNAGDESDRLLAVWPVAGPRVAAACACDVPEPAPAPADAVVALGERDDRPVEGRGDGRVLLVATPRDVETLRRARPATAAAWRRAVRASLGGLLDDGARVTGFTAAGEYIVERS